MTFSARSPLKKISWDTGQSSGWAAFDLKQRHKNNVESEIDKDPFPPVGAFDCMGHGDKLKKKHVPVKSFSSVLLPGKSFPSLNEDGNSEMKMLGSHTGVKYCGTSAQEDVNLAVKKLNEKHVWAEISLVEDVLAAANNNVDKASSLLESMASAFSCDEGKVSSNPGTTTTDDIPYDEKTDESFTLGKFKEEIPFHSSLAGHLKDIDIDLEDRNASSDRRLFDEDNLRFNMGLLSSVPIEPEWEEDDIYMKHRKDALKMMRSASRHSRAATNAFMRGDHFYAQQYSMKAQEEWQTAEELNSKAATEILSIRNSENDIWRLDLHGLHATEAIRALEDHLNRIECQVFSNSFATSNGVKENGLARSAAGSFNGIDRANLSNQQGPLRLRSFVLHVITGIGNHSRGQASLPTAVRNFLIEKRYRYEDTRPGVIVVWPKFRQS
ncbi:hypothetical protein Lal_00012979 [Lupinus albus]|uniref:Putative Smr domain-containing protein n=1 Tax=Lupinus albus TaxID=3870 RepID=A0A6A5NG22_LUPAL|nr:putative Smr domain-containing protein [Lupinus albus]KAF1884019.1 hypothetical protein Lal_00012979 [Lupinus albus]